MELFLEDPFPATDDRCMKITKVAIVIAMIVVVLVVFACAIVLHLI